MVRRADGDDAVHARIAAAVAQPGANRQPAHAVRHQQRRLPGGCGQTLHRGFDQRRVVVDAAEHRLQVQRDAGHTALAQWRPPAVPDAAVADEAMHQEQPATALGVGRQMVGEAVPAPGDVPAKGMHRTGGLGGPGAQQIPGAGPRCRVVATGPAQQHEFHCHQRHMQQRQQQHAQHQPQREAPGQPAQQREQRPQQQEQRQRLQQPCHLHAPDCGAGYRAHFGAMPLRRSRASW